MVVSPIFHLGRGRVEGGEGDGGGGVGGQDIDVIEETWQWLGIDAKMCADGALITIGGGGTVAVQLDGRAGGAPP